MDPRDPADADGAGPGPRGIHWQPLSPAPAMPSNPQGTSLSIQNIRLFGDPVLRTPAEPVVDFDRELRQLVKDLTETMVDAPGAGLAAPQIGVGLRVFTYWSRRRARAPRQPRPRPLRRAARTARRAACRSRGCGSRRRARLRTVAKGFNQFGEPVVVEGSELLARCLQHETDHLDGILFIDRMDREQRKAGHEGDPRGGVGRWPTPRSSRSARTPPSAGACDAAGLRRHPRRRRCPSLDALVASPHEVVAVVTRPDARAGRGRGAGARRRCASGPRSSASRC